MADVLIKNGLLIDGSGDKGKVQDIAIEGDKILALGSLTGVNAETIIDAQGKVVVPGFIDIHSHADLSLPLAPYAESLAHQGITTVVTGQCGSSPAPLSEETRGLFIDSLGEDIPKELFEGIDSFGSFLDFVEKQGISINMEPLVGHGTIRLAVMGFTDKRPDEDQITAMQRYAEQAMEEGAIGLSTGLIYPPGYYSKTDELIEVTKPVAKAGGFYFSHVRGEGAELLDSIEEEMQIARATGASVQHAHYKAAGEANWGLSAKGLALIDKARAEGIDMSVDMYPYIASSNGLIDSLPDWAREGSLEKTIARLKDPSERARMRKLMLGQAWDKNLIAGSPNPDYVGRYVAELAAAAEKDPYEWVFDALIETNGDMSRIVFGMSEENVKAQLQYEHMMIGTDGYGIPPEGPIAKGAPHPRSFGTFPRVLGKYVRDEKILSLETAIRKMTAMPAEKLGLKDRGYLRRGYKADLVIFDPESVIDVATFVAPKQYPAGIEQVMVNGQFVIRNQKHTHALAGRILSRS